MNLPTNLISNMMTDLLSGSSAKASKPEGEANTGGQIGFTDLLGQALDQLQAQLQAQIQTLLPEADDHGTQALADESSGDLPEETKNATDVLTHLQSQAGISEEITELTDPIPDGSANSIPQPPVHILQHPALYLSSTLGDAPASPAVSVHPSGTDAIGSAETLDPATNTVIRSTLTNHDLVPEQAHAKTSETVATKNLTDTDTSKKSAPIIPDAVPTGEKPGTEKTGASSDTLFTAESRNPQAGPDSQPSQHSQSPANEQVLQHAQGQPLQAGISTLTPAGLSQARQTSVPDPAMAQPAQNPDVKSGNLKPHPQPAAQATHAESDILQNSAQPEVATTKAPDVSNPASFTERMEEVEIQLGTLQASSKQSKGDNPANRPSILPAHGLATPSESNTLKATVSADYPTLQPEGLPADAPDMSNLSDRIQQEVSSEADVSLAYHEAPTQANPVSTLPIPNEFVEISVHGTTAPGSGPLLEKPGTSQASTQASYIPQAADIADQVVEGTQYSLKSGHKELTIKLNPEHLGEVRVNLSSNAQQILSARLIASSAEAHEQLQNQIHTLKQSLEAQGVQVDRITVVLAGDTQNQTQHDRSQHQQQEQRFQQTPEQQMAGQQHASHQGMSHPEHAIKHGYGKSSLLSGQLASPSASDPVETDSRHTVNHQGGISILV